MEEYIIKTCITPKLSNALGFLMDLAQRYEGYELVKYEAEILPDNLTVMNIALLKRKSFLKRLFL